MTKIDSENQGLLQALEEVFHRERLFREDYSQSLMRELRGFVEERLRYWTVQRAVLPLQKEAKLFTHTIDGHRVILDATEPFIAFHVIEHGCWEAPVRHVLRGLLRDGDHYVDVGANIGLHSLYASSLVGPHGKVVALEPHPATASMLQENIEINGLHTRIQVVLAAACEEHDGSKSFQYFPQHSAMSGFSLAPNRVKEFHGTPQTIDVATVRLDRLLISEQLETPLIKIDVEGFERDVIEGLGAHLEDPEIGIITEFDPQVMSEIFGPEASKSLFAQLTSDGFESFVIDEDGLSGVLNYEEIERGGDILWVRPGSRYHGRAQAILTGA